MPDHLRRFDAAAVGQLTELLHATLAGFGPPEGCSFDALPVLARTAGEVVRAVRAHVAAAAVVSAEPAVDTRQLADLSGSWSDVRIALAAHERALQEAGS